MPFWDAFWMVAVGVAISIVLPVLKKSYPKLTAEPIRAIWDVAKPYVALGFGSLATAFLIMAGMASIGKPIEFWHQALLLGYFSDSTLQKFK